jgi:hypothetical protein
VARAGIGEASCPWRPTYYSGPLRWLKYDRLFQKYKMVTRDAEYRSNSFLHQRRETLGFYAAGHIGVRVLRAGPKDGRRAERIHLSAQEGSCWTRKKRCRTWRRKPFLLEALSFLSGEKGIEFIPPRPGYELLGDHFLIPSFPACSKKEWTGQHVVLALKEPSWILSAGEK